MTTELNNRVGARIREQREFLGFSQEKLSESVGISPQFLSEIERGIKGASAATLYKLCEGLNISSDVVLMGKEKPADVSEITATLAMLDEKYVPHAEELLKAFVKAVGLK